jgi:hypothetical protein
MEYLALAYLIIWGALFAYIGRLSAKNGELFKNLRILVEYWDEQASNNAPQRR